MKRTKDESMKTRTAILASAEQLFMEKGYESTSLSEIVAAAGLTRGALYWHFRDKDELFTEVIRAMLSAFYEEKTAIADNPSLTRTQRLTQLLMLPIEGNMEYRLVNRALELAETIPALAPLKAEVRDAKDKLFVLLSDILSAPCDNTAPLSRESIPVIAGILYFMFEGFYLDASEIRRLSYNDILAMVRVVTGDVS